jgi:hypothetical protein
MFTFVDKVEPQKCQLLYYPWIHRHQRITPEPNVLKHFVDVILYFNVHNYLQCLNLVCLSNPV